MTSPRWPPALRLRISMSEDGRCWLSLSWRRRATSRPSPRWPPAGRCRWQHQRIGGAYSLSRLAVKGDQRVIATVSIRLEHADEDVRRWALKALADLAVKGDQLAITMVAMHLEHADEHVGASAVVPLAGLAAKGYQRAIVAVAARIEDADPRVSESHCTVSLS